MMLLFWTNQFLISFQFLISGFELEAMETKEPAQSSRPDKARFLSLTCYCFVSMNSFCFEFTLQRSCDPTQSGERQELMTAMWRPGKHFMTHLYSTVSRCRWPQPQSAGRSRRRLGSNYRLVQVVNQWHQLVKIHMIILCIQWFFKLDMAAGATHESPAKVERDRGLHERPEAEAWTASCHDSRLFFHVM